MENYIQTNSGKKFHFMEPKDEEIDINDIAWALAMQCRFAGHISRFYSVAEHSLNVARLVPDSLKLEALLHDAAEAYLTDIPSPVKAFLPDYFDMEKGVDRAIRRKFRVKKSDYKLVREADKACLTAEAQKLLIGGDKPDHWSYSPDYESVYKLQSKFVIGHKPEYAANLFIKAFEAYKKGQPFVTKSVARDDSLLAVAFG